MKRTLILAFLLLFVVISQVGCNGTSTNVANNSGKASPSPPPSPTETRTTQPGVHCGDSPPANPSNCNINKPFNIGCNLPFSNGQSHEIDQRCPNEGCASRESDKAQNKIKNNYCAAGTPVQISVTTLDKLQTAVDQMVQQGQISYGSDGPPQP